MPDAHGEDGEIVHEGWLLKSRESMMKLPFIRSNKWVKRYFVLRSGPHPGQCRLDSYHDDRKRKRTKSLNLEQCTQVDSYLRMTQADRHKEWIFSMHFDRRELYLAADNEEQMNRWVTKLCAVCNLERQESNSPVQFDSYGEEPSMTAGISYDSVLNTPVTDEQNFANMLAERFNEEDEDRFCSFEFPPVAAKARPPFNAHSDAFNDPVANYQHINSFSSAGGVQTVGQQGYVHLTQCISAEPRPIGRGGPKGTSQTSGAMTLPLAPPAPIAPTHLRGPSSDSTGSSQRSISVSDNESSVHNTPSGDGLPNLDAVPPPPRPPKTPSAVPVSVLNAYSNDMPKKLPPGYDVPLSTQYLNQRPPAPDPVDDEGGSSAETIKPPVDGNDGDSYMNMPTPSEDSRPAPTVDRSKKPTRNNKSVDGDVSDKDENPPKPHSVRINRIDSFVKKSSPNPTPQGTPQSQQHDRPRVPAMLPKTNPRTRMTDRQIVHSPVASPSATRQGGANPQLEYIDPTFVNQPGTPRSARTPSPRTGPVAEPVNSFPSPSKVNYAVINEKATKAIGETISVIEASRTLERKKH